MSRENESEICRRCVTTVYHKAMITRARCTGTVLAMLAATLRLLRHQLGKYVAFKKQNLVAF